MSKCYTTINVDFISFSEQTYWHYKKSQHNSSLPCFQSSTETFHFMPDAVGEDFLLLFLFLIEEFLWKEIWA